MSAQRLGARRHFVTLQTSLYVHRVSTDLGTVLTAARKARDVHGSGVHGGSGAATRRGQRCSRASAGRSERSRQHAPARASARSRKQQSMHAMTQPQPASTPSRPRPSPAHERAAEKVPVLGEVAEDSLPAVVRQRGGARGGRGAGTAGSGIGGHGALEPGGPAAGRHSQPGGWLRLPGLGLPGR